MEIKKVVITNFKGFKDKFTIILNSGLNIIVGDNEAGKSTILEAINLALTGMFNGRYIRNELSQYLFNEKAVSDYIKSIKDDSPLPPPSICIELFIIGKAEVAPLEGDKNSDGIGHSGISFSIEFNEIYKSSYEALLKTGDVKTIPIEYYHVVWRSFARDAIIARNIPLKSAYIDSSSSRNKNGSDVYIGRIVKELLSEDEIVSVSQSHRQMKEQFMDAPSIEAINHKISEAGKISNKEIKISVELSSRNAWETGLTTYLDNIPFHFIGKGEQSIIKTNLALAHNKAKEANVILLEEPENHLSHSKLNQLIDAIKEGDDDKQIIVTTHNSYVANKLGLDDLILLNDRKTLKLDDLSPETKTFFEKISGYDTLRLMLCKKAILVEGDSDELIVQRAYQDRNEGKLPINDEIEVISVGVSFLRFLEIAEKLNQPVSIVTDNDGNIEALKKKYKDYLGGNTKLNIKICFDNIIDTGTLKIGDKPFNYNTLEPKLLKANDLTTINKMFGTEYEEINDLHKFMRNNKTECALKIFQANEKIKYPQYILDAIT
ncbi:ATP-dependent endonuclease [Tenacibaculum sp. E3R01]|uniref:ATP-dependent nuclease n=1 Tax=Tenacibaculum sp. E3R01 TaxID=2267227 RepID=UPI000DEA1C43|nr:AAA family ATPase [Tenacibaculum sp. E3R01]RBW59543.1 ATP-dependent endonuclease [Tenacibaculum sp. E3R01]